MTNKDEYAIMAGGFDTVPTAASMGEVQFDAESSPQRAAHRDDNPASPTTSRDDWLIMRELMLCEDLNAALRFVDEKLSTICERNLTKGE